MKILTLLIAILFISCKNDNSYDLKSNENPDNGFRISMNQKKTELSIKSLYKNSIDNGFNFYYTKINNEFYSTDSTYSKSAALNKIPELSSINEYNKFIGTEFEGDSMIIKNKAKKFMTRYVNFEFPVKRVFEIYYDKQYLISKIVINSIEYK